MRRLFLLSALWFLPSARGQEFERIVIDNDFPGVYQVEVADVNGDKKPDIVALGGGTCAWFENPTWTKRIITGPDQTPGIITSATTDLDGDGKAEVAIGYEFAMREPKKGKLGLAVQGEGGAWSFRHVADVGSIHRIRWMAGKREDSPWLVVAPIFGPEARPPNYADPANVAAYIPKERGRITGEWESVPLVTRPVIHAIEVRGNTILTAHNLGVGATTGSALLGGVPSTRDLFPGAEGEPPQRGCSEIHAGTLREGREFFATIEPWHGNEVAVWTRERPQGAFEEPPAYHRTVLDDTLDAGHALWVADIDRDGDDEVFAGHRGKDHRVSMYKYDPKADRWDRTVIDRDIAAQDLRGGDLDGDGTPDVVAVGGSTHNVVWYRPKKP